MTHNPFFFKTCLHTPARVARMLRVVFIGLGALVLCPATGYTAAQDSPPALRICTAIAPLAFCIEHIGGDLIAVDTLLPEGQDPHLFEPGPRLLHRLSQAHIYLMAGLPFERILIGKIAARQATLTIVDPGAEIRFLDAGHTDDQPGCSGDHGADSTHSGRDPHFWLGVQQLRQFIRAAERVITNADPEHAATYARNTARLLARLDRVHARNLSLLEPYRNRTFFVYHPAFGYFAHTYGMRQQAVEISGHQPGPRHITSLIKQARSSNVRAIFVQPQFDTKSAQTIAAAINGVVLPLDPLAKNVIQNLETMAEAVARACKDQEAHP